MAADLIHDKHEETPIPVYVQYENLPQQLDSYTIGMWTFLVTEVMMFGALFATYALYRWKYQPYFYELHHDLDWKLGGINTMVLLFSSFLMACAVHFAQKKDKMKQLACLGGTIMCAFGFLIIKFFEYRHKIELGHFPGHLWNGYQWNWTNAEVPTNIAQVFFSLYFVMTGLHGIHVLIGIIVIGALMWLRFKDKPSVTDDYMPTEMVGLYWHFVDLVWIFLFPLYYLLPK